MKELPKTRRDFMKTTAMGAAGIILAKPMILSAQASGSIRIEAPFHGAVLNRRQGKQIGRGLKIKVSGKTPLGGRVVVNGLPAQRDGMKFTSEIILRQKQTDIVAVSENNFGRHEHRVQVIWDRNSVPRYRFSIDDNSFFLRDIAKNNYASLFDCFYLKNLRRLHSKYGTRFVLNIYYTTEDGFELPQFPDRYKSQWRDNSHWL
jgi:hypothetical protein